MSEATPPWQWPERTWRGHVERVRAGRPLTPTRWPGGARVAVALSFDVDHETIPLRDGETSPGRLAQGEYGARVAMPRILRLLAEHDVPASFFVPAVSALLHPASVEECVAAGHEIAAHGWIHERNTLLSAADELDLTGRSLDTLERLSGTRPVGIRTPSWDFSESTLDIIRTLGFRYDSSLMADDEPYELLADGTPTGVVELPVEWIRDDMPYLGMERHSALRPYTPPRALLEIWRDEFDAAHAEGGLFQLTLHPHVIGHRSRLVVLRELLAHMRAHTDVWFATHAAVADAALAVTAPPKEATP
ncbi:polysaccharide deacetylase family protein [Prauserella cavernicola]|uniref:Polysaccharide deacetylase n=1 Tax=Prauserella cavernicola TaxID=2800127 RepID=A0A934V3Y3_9PSEU|nr:polysaccharide deacetylase [Prauserella cavernicola]MBK1783535.1 polysaccharide deacetylase [Prauserella cavernicola]